MQEQSAIAKNLLDTARVMNANEGINNVDHVPDWMRIRRTTGIPWLLSSMSGPAGALPGGSGDSMVFPDGLAQCWSVAIPAIQTALNGGEFSPERFGRVDLDKYRKATSTLRNFYASYRGGASTRAGTRFVGVCGQGTRGPQIRSCRRATFHSSSRQRRAM